MILAGCGSPSGSGGSTASTGGSVAPNCDPAAFRAVRATHADHTEVTLCGTVVRAGRVRRSRSGVHRVFFVGLGGTERVAVDANLDVMGDFPIHAGERAIVRGEYYYDGSGRDGVHWTHRTNRGSHPPGYVSLDGVTYR